MAKPRHSAPQEEDFEEIPDTELDQSLLGDLAILSGAEFQDVDWYIYRLKNKTERNENPGGSPRELVARKVGGIDLLELAAEIGGGDFIFFPVYDAGDGRGKRLQKQQRHSLAGPRKNFNQPAPSTPNSATGDPLLARLDQIGARLERLEQGGAGGGLTQLVQSLAALDALRARQPALPPAPPSTPLKDLAETLVMLEGMREKHNVTVPATNPDLEVVKIYASVLEKGIAIGEGREPAEKDEGGTNWAKVIADGIETFARMAEARRVRQGAPPVNGPRPVETQTAGSPPLTQEELRWLVLLEALERAFAEEQDPEVMATTLETILPAVQLAELKRDPPGVISRLMPIIQARHPSLATDQARNYVGQVIAQLIDTSPGVEVVEPQV